MRIACLQFSPQVGEVSKNISKADALLAASAAELEEGIDLLVLPEMAFSGYNFRSQPHILPYLESPSSGPTATWAKQKAQSLNCTVAVGYPELHSHTDKEYYNSLLVVNNRGDQVANYRKSFLYYTDATWAKEGPGFYADSPDSQQVIIPGKKTAMGICMDINPYQFTNPWDLYEFARHCLRVRANLVVVSMAWLTLEMRERFLTGREARPDMETLAYWVGRLEPLIRHGGGDEEGGEEVIVVFANRCGWEEEAVYAGSSAVMGVKGGEVRVYGVLGRGVEECLVVDTEGEGVGRLVTRKRDDSEDEEEKEAEEEQKQNSDENEKPTTGPSQPSNNSSNSNELSQPPPSSTFSTHQQHLNQSHRHRPKLTLLTDPLTIPPFRSSPPPPPIHLPKNLSISITPHTFYNSLLTTPPHPHSEVLWSISPNYDNDDPFSDKHATGPTDATEITSFPVSFSSSFSPSFCSESFSPRSLSSLEDEDDDDEVDANEYFEAWLVSPVEDDRRRGEGKLRLGEWEEERLRGWKWPSAGVREVDEDEDGGEEVSPRTMSKGEEEEEGMIRIVASPSVFADLKMPVARFWTEDRRARGVGAR